MAPDFVFAVYRTGVVNVILELIMDQDEDTVQIEIEVPYSHMKGIANQLWSNNRLESPSLSLSGFLILLGLMDSFKPGHLCYVEHKYTPTLRKLSQIEVDILPLIKRLEPGIGIDEEPDHGPHAPRPARGASPGCAASRAGSIATCRIRVRFQV